MSYAKPFGARNSPYVPVAARSNPKFKRMDSNSEAGAKRTASRRTSADRPVRPRTSSSSTRSRARTVDRSVLKYYNTRKMANVKKKIKKAKSRSKVAVEELMKKLVSSDADMTDNENIRKAFDAVDVNGDGELQLREFMTAMQKNLGLAYSNKELKKFFFEIDSDDNGVVDYEEFKALVLNLTTEFE